RRARAVGAKDRDKMSDYFDIIDTIRHTEKGTLLIEKHNQYIFRVNPRANKVQIKQAIEKLLGKKVARVNTMNYSGKERRERGGPMGRRAHWKKAIVT